MTHSLLVINLAAMLALCWQPTKAQTATTKADTSELIYLLEVSPKAEHPPAVAELNGFAKKMLELRLASLRSFLVVKQSEPPGCSALGSVDRVPAFYVIRAVVKSQTENPEKRDAEMMLDYELLKYVRCEATSLTRGTEAIKEHTALSSLNTMVDVMALFLEEERNTKRASLHVAVPTGASPSLQAVQDKTVDYMVARLKQEGEFETRDLRTEKPEQPADFTVRADFTSSQRGLSVRITVALKDGRSFKSRVESVPSKGSEEQLAKFYEGAAIMAATFLKDVRNAVVAGLSGPLSDEKAVSMEKRALELLCIKNGQPSFMNCSAQPEAAIPLLAELTEKKKSANPQLLLQLLGDAYLDLEEHLEAALAFDKARALVGETALESRLTLLSKSAEAWYQAKNYAEAAVRFDEFIQLGAANKNSLPPSFESLDKTILQRSRSYHFLGEHSKALRLLLQSLDLLSNRGRAIGGDLRALIDSVTEHLRGKELEDAVAQLEQSATKEMQWWPIRSSLWSAQNQLARDWLLSAEVAYLGAEFDKMNTLLNRNESIPVEILGYATRGEVLRQRALWQRDSKHDFAAALQTLDKALLLDISDEEVNWRIRLQKAETYVLNRNYQEAISLLSRPATFEPETAQYGPLMYFYLVWSLLAQDKEREATDVASQWKSSMEQLRKDAETVPWVFTSARTSLNNDTSISPERKEKLLAMMTAMSTKEDALPPLFATPESPTP